LQRATPVRGGKNCEQAQHKGKRFYASIWAITRHIHQTTRAVDHRLQQRMVIGCYSKHADGQQDGEGTAIDQMPVLQP
jgi:hypothetical protein